MLTQASFFRSVKQGMLTIFKASLYDILIYSDSEEEHEQHVKWVMQRLLEAGLYLEPERCKFHKETVSYLGLIISTKGISMDEDTVQMVGNWTRENKTKNRRCNTLFKIQQFFGFCNY